MINKKWLLLGPTTLAILPLVVSCATTGEQKVDALKNEKGVDIKFSAKVKFTFEDVQIANSVEEKADLIVGNFSSSQQDVNLEYSFVEGLDADFFRVDNSTNQKFIYLKSSKFEEILNSGKEKYRFNIKAVYKNKYSVAETNFQIAMPTETEWISLIKDNYQDNKAAQKIKYAEHFDVKVSLEANTKGAVVNYGINTKRIAKFGAIDNSQRTFYSPIDLTEEEVVQRTKEGLPTKPEIIFTSKSEQGTYISTLQLYLLSNPIAEDNKAEMIGITYEKLDGSVIEVKNIEDTRTDITKILGDPKDHIRTMRFISIFEKVKKITFNFKKRDAKGAYPYISEILFRGQEISNSNYTQIEGPKELSDRNFATYLNSNPLSKSNNVLLKKGDQVSFAFDPTKNTKLKQIQLYKAPMGYTDKNQKIEAWRIRPKTIAKYQYTIDFADNTRVILNVVGWGLELDNTTLPEKYLNKVVRKVTIVAVNPLELKEIMFV